MSKSEKKTTPFLKALIVVCLLVNTYFAACYSQNSSDVSIYETKLDQEKNPIGVDNESPEFSWKLKSDKRNRYQKAYQIVVWSKKTKDTCWNSGKVISNSTILRKYLGKPLESVTAYKWRIRIWDNNGKISSWSTENDFSTGLLAEKDWKADWISTPDSIYAPVFTKKFRIDKIPDLANVFVNCQGYFELYINGNKVGNDVLSPAVSNFKTENYYLAYDVKDFLRIGENTIGLWTGRGWYSAGLPGVIHQSPVFRLQAHLLSKQIDLIIVSDTTWTTSNSNISQIGNMRWNNLGGELVDNRISMNDWATDKNNNNRKNAIRIAKPTATTKSQICRPNFISESIAVKNISQIDKDVWLIDFGKNFTGWMKMDIENQKLGDTIDFIYSDFCNKKPEKKSKYKWDFGNEYINQRDGYISSSSKKGVFCPKFNVHAFRYVIIQG